MDEDVLAPLGSKHLEYRIGFELIAHSGRRPAEICNLTGDCLRYEEEPASDGGKHRRPVLRYLREKPPSKWLSLPINQDAAELIEAQQRRLQARFSGTKLRKLALLPRRKCNPTGRLPVISPTLSYRVSKWVRAIPTLLDENGGAFPSESVYLYALRHSYAQRHADAGVVRFLPGNRDVLVLRSRPCEDDRCRPREAVLDAARTTTARHGRLSRGDVTRERRIEEAS